MCRMRDHWGRTRASQGGSRSGEPADTFTSCSRQDARAPSDNSSGSSAVVSNECSKAKEGAATARAVPLCAGATSKLTGNGLSHNPDPETDLPSRSMFGSGFSFSGSANCSRQLAYVSARDGWSASTSPAGSHTAMSAVVDDVDSYVNPYNSSALPAAPGVAQLQEQPVGGAAVNALASCRKHELPTAERGKRPLPAATVMDGAHAASKRGTASQRMQSDTAELQRRQNDRGGSTLVQPRELERMRRSPARIAEPDAPALADGQVPAARDSCGLWPLTPAASGNEASTSAHAPQLRLSVEGERTWKAAPEPIQLAMSNGRVGVEAQEQLSDHAYSTLKAQSGNKPRSALASGASSSTPVAPASSAGNRTPLADSGSPYAVSSGRGSGYHEHVPANGALAADGAAREDGAWQQDADPTAGEQPVTKLARG